MAGGFSNRDTSDAEAIRLSEIAFLDFQNRHGNSGTYRSLARGSKQ